MVTPNELSLTFMWPWLHSSLKYIVVKMNQRKFPVAQCNWFLHDGRGQLKRRSWSSIPLVIILGHVHSEISFYKRKSASSSLCTRPSHHLSNLLFVQQDENKNKPGVFSIHSSSLSSLVFFFPPSIICSLILMPLPGSLILDSVQTGPDNIKVYSH